MLILTLSALALAMLALYISAKAAFRQAERAAEPEPSIMTELDRARSEIAFLKKDREAILREYRRLQVRIEELSK